LAEFIVILIFYIKDGKLPIYFSI